MTMIVVLIASPARYTMTGSAALGPLRCVDSSYVSSISTWTGTSASTVTYRRQDAGVKEKTSWKRRNR